MVEPFDTSIHNKIPRLHSGRHHQATGLSEAENLRQERLRQRQLSVPEPVSRPALPLFASEAMQRAATLREEEGGGGGGGDGGGGGGGGNSAPAAGCGSCAIERRVGYTSSSEVRLATTRPRGSDAPARAPPETISGTRAEAS